MKINYLKNRWYTVSWKGEVVFYADLSSNVWSRLGKDYNVWNFSPWLFMASIHCMRPYMDASAGDRQAAYVGEWISVVESSDDIGWCWQWQTRRMRLSEFTLEFEYAWSSITLTLQYWNRAGKVLEGCRRSCRLKEVISGSRPTYRQWVKVLDLHFARRPRPSSSLVNEFHSTQRPHRCFLTVLLMSVV